ncbi:MAG: DUF3253 domain-containing protein [Actinobacteria bacterium]|nr:DUF3253 domain-containing protein [Actinomycetota bacterium]
MGADRRRPVDSPRLAAAIRTILRGRPTGSMCPSEAARIAGGESWRALMPLVREIARAMHDAGEIRIQQGGLDVPPGVSGPIRLAPGPRCGAGIPLGEAPAYA